MKSLLEFQTDFKGLTEGHELIFRGMSSLKEVKMESVVEKKKATKKEGRELMKLVEEQSSGMLFKLSFRKDGHGGCKESRNKSDYISMQ